VKRLIVPMGLAFAAVVPGVAVAANPAGASTPNRPTAAHIRSYEHAYKAVAAKLGRRAPGRNIVKDGLATGGTASDAQVVASLAVLERMLAPTPSSSSTATSYSTAGGSAAGAAGVPACASESGTNYSTGPSNTNPSSGATGRYQILPSTAAAYGCDLSTPAGQDACAQTIYAHQGAGAWVGCGG
jgi:Transglycosylase-like domain